MAAADLYEQYSRIEAITDPQRRGRAFEDYVAALFAASHFEVTKDAGSARPRQTDLLATRATETYLIECKWRSARADIDDVDGLRSRLRRTNGTVGLLISNSGFSGTAISEVADHRHQPILLLSGEEIRRLARRPEQLAHLLWRKRQALQVDGKALVDEPAQPRRTRTRRPLPGSASRFVAAGRPDAPVFACGGGFDQFTFAHDVVDVDWVIAAGSGATLDVDVPAFDERDVLAVIDKLADLGWTSPDARWSIQQARTNWHGFGAAAFASELSQWKARADTPKAHHSEEFCYVDNCDGGFYTLTSTIGADDYRRATQTHLSIQLHGVPLDTGPLLQLCRSIGVHHGTYFRTLAERSRRVLHLPDWMRVPIEPIAHIVTSGTSIDPEMEFVTGIVIPNPFSLVQWRQSEEWSTAGLQHIESAEYLVCDLGEHHLRDGKPYTYWLTKVEVARTSAAAVFVPGVRWDLA
ncbi:restriction endonuclease [Micromonospora chokoriensis]|uniref:restriction endonuclease n=1 Tax=Micromonospora chokoriensis TaxID=356851 RepID=UPI0004C43CD9|nr:restriction endonuclease [Micromonospora chokoriensis]